MHFNGLTKPFAVALLGLSCMCSQAQDIYVENTISQLGELNPVNGAYTLIGTTSARIGGFADVGGTLYGIADDNNLYTINTTTAALTEVGGVGFAGGGYGLGETSNGTLYALLQTNNMYTINPITAMPTFVGDTGFSSNCDPSGDASGRLYNAQGAYGNGIYSINTTTGLGTLLGTDSIGSVLALAYLSGTMYAINTTGSIYDINLTDGSATFQTNYDVDTVGSVYAAGVSATPAQAPSGVPEPGSLAFVFGVGLTGGAFAIRRYKFRIA